MRGLVVLLAFGLLLAPLAAHAQQPARPHRIGILNASFSGIMVAARLPWLAEYGYVEGRDVAFESRFAAGRDERLPELAADLVRRKVDVIVTPGMLAARAAKQATGTIPIVMVVEGDPVKAGLVSSLARPGGNVTGVTTLTAELNGKRLQLLKDTVPGLRRSAVIWNPNDPLKAEEWNELREAAQVLGLQLQSLEVRRASDIGALFKGGKGERPGALLVLGDNLTFSHAKAIADLAAKNRLPAMYPSRWFVESFSHEGLMSYAPSELDASRRIAAYVDKILKGAKPADLPVEQPTQIELVVNLKAAQAIGLTIPKSVLARADKIIE